MKKTLLVSLSCLLISLLAACDLFRSGPTDECKNLDFQVEQFEEFLQRLLEEQGIDEPAMIDGEPNPILFDANGDLNTTDDGHLSNYYMHLQDIEIVGESCENSR